MNEPHSNEFEGGGHRVYTKVGGRFHSSTNVVWKPKYPAYHARVRRNVIKPARGTTTGLARHRDIVVVVSLKIKHRTCSSTWVASLLMACSFSAWSGRWVLHSAWSRSSITRTYEQKTPPISTWRRRRSAVFSDGFARQNQTHATGSSDAHATMAIHGVAIVRGGSTVNGSDQSVRDRYGYYTYYYVYTTTLTHVIRQYETVDWSSGPRGIVTVCTALAALPRPLHHTHPNQVNTSSNRDEGVTGGWEKG